jgi:HPt (histidine-containing phosphotransfer) domain-containing protein
MMHSDKTGRILDLDVVLARVDNDRRLLAELATIFLQDYPRLRNEIQQSLLQDDHSSLERAAHTLKGRLAFFGIHTAIEQAGALEKMGRTNDLSCARQTVAEIDAEMKSILLELESLTREQTT